MTHDDSRMRALIALARKMPHTESARRNAASFASFEARLAARGSSLRVRLWWASAAGLSVALALFAFLALPDMRPIAFVSERLVAPSTQANPEQAPSERLSFTDGSQVTLEGRAKVEVEQLTGRGARVRLNRGHAEVAIAKRKKAAWQFEAGPYTVRVTGTAFRLSWSAQQEQLEIGMRHGSVIVTGPMAEQGVPLKAGQRLVGSPRAHRLLVEDWRGTSERATVAQVEPVRSATPPAAPANEPHEARERARTLADRNWEKSVARGEFESVLREARARGIPRVLAAAPASDLGALADAARYARQNGLSQKALLALRSRFPQSELARDSAFLLGRLSEDKSALSWYERYLEERPQGPYVAQALGRSMMLYYERGANGRASELARTYLSRFPSGPYAASARKLTALVRASSNTP